MGSTYETVKTLEKDLAQAKTVTDAAAMAEIYKTAIIEDMTRLRATVDAMETLSDGKYRPYPSHGDILFGVR